MAPKRGKFRLVVFVLLVALAALAAVGIGYTSLGRQLNQYAGDVFFRLRGTDQAGVADIAVVAMDDATLARFGNPPDRAVLARALEAVCGANPKVVGIDLLFSAPSNPDSDAALIRALAKCPQAVLATSLVSEDPTSLEAAGWADPLPDFARLAGGLGHAHADPDVDGVCRQVLLAKTAGGVRHWALALEMLRVESGTNKVFEPDESTLVIGTHIVPAPRDTTSGPGGAHDQRPLLINFAGREGIFHRYSFVQVVENEVAPSAFAGRAVLIGVTAPAAGIDRKFTPVSSLGSDMAGVEIHANALRTLETGRFLEPLRDSTTLAAMLVIAAVVGVLLGLLRGAGLAAALVCLAAVVHVVPYLLFVDRRLLAPAFSFALSFWMPLLVGGLFQYRTVWRRYREADTASRRLRGGLEMVAHEIRSPLTTIQGSAEVISRYPLDEARRKQLGELVSRESQRVANLVARFLDVERLESGEMQLHREAVALRPIVARSLERAQALAARKTIAVDFTAAASPETSGDAELLEFAVYNLLSNAIKYSPENSKVEVRLAANAALHTAFIEVKDQGAGISKEDQAKIFDKFFRTDGAESSGQAGLGLGLSIVREIARHHDGSVLVESMPGRGSKFSLVLPLLAAARASAAGTDA